MFTSTVAILDFGSQYTALIARRVRECGVYSQVYAYGTSAEALQRDGVCAIILSGGPRSTVAPGAPRPDEAIFRMGVPILGICYGLQLLGALPGGKIEASERREYGPGVLQISKPGDLFQGMKQRLRVWNSHIDRMVSLPHGFVVLGSTDNTMFAAIEDPERRIYGLQFHPEVAHTEDGVSILRNFLYRICHCAGDWSMADYRSLAIEAIRDQVGQERVILGLSGGVDSSVTAVLLHQAIGSQLTCIFVDNGLCRLHERESVVREFRQHLRMNLRVVRAGQQFLNALKGVTDPERKRKVIGRTFINVFEQEVKKMDSVSFLAQGTLYSDVIESVSINGNPATLIKSHHNVGGLPKTMRLKLIEPLAKLFKDEVRALGAELGLPTELLNRHPFPGPGLGIRILGEVTRKRLAILRQADAILQEEIRAAGFYDQLWQAFAVFLPVRTVGVMGDDRTYDHVIALRVVESVDAMTADWARLPYDLLQVLANRIINEVSGVNRVVLDISSKPPSTIEWE